MVSDIDMQPQRPPSSSRPSSSSTHLPCPFFPCPAQTRTSVLFVSLIDVRLSCLASSADSALTSRLKHISFIFDLRPTLNLSAHTKRTQGTASSYLLFTRFTPLACCQLPESFSLVLRICSITVRPVESLPVVPTPASRYRGFRCVAHGVAKRSSPILHIQRLW